MVEKLRLRQFTLAFKLRIVSYYESLQDGRHMRDRSLGFVSKKSGISRQCIRNWVRDKDKLVNQSRKHFRSKVKYTKDRCECEEMERMIVDWLKVERSKGVCISEKSLRSKAIEFYNEIHPEEENETLFVSNRMRTCKLE